MGMENEKEIRELEAIIDGCNKEIDICYKVILSEPEKEKALKKIINSFGLIKRDALRRIRFLQQMAKKAS